MFVELQEPKARKLMHQCHAHAIEDALVIVFHYDRPGARDAVGKVTGRFDKAPLATRDAFAHEDPLKLAAEIAQVPATVFQDAQYADRIKEYDTKVRADYEKWGAEHYEQWIKPIFQRTMRRG
jgi:hypothetical protein